MIHPSGSSFRLFSVIFVHPLRQQSRIKYQPHQSDHNRVVGLLSTSVFSQDGHGLQPCDPGKALQALVADLGAKTANPILALLAVDEVAYSSCLHQLENGRLDDMYSTHLRSRWRRHLILARCSRPWSVIRSHFLQHHGHGGLSHQAWHSKCDRVDASRNSLEVQVRHALDLGQTPEALIGDLSTSPVAIFTNEPMELISRL